MIFALVGRFGLEKTIVFDANTLDQVQLRLQKVYMALLVFQQLLKIAIET